jgi:hypothetical protein
LYDFLKKRGILPMIERQEMEVSKWKKEWMITRTKKNRLIGRIQSNGQK